jgi:hypothetical protein
MLKSELGMTESLCEHEYFFGDGFRQCVKCFLLEIKVESNYLKHKRQPGVMIVEEFSDVLSPIEPDSTELKTEDNEIIPIDPVSVLSKTGDAEDAEIINADDISDIENIDDNYEEDEI